jgi:hypothetical protein
MHQPGYIQEGQEAIFGYLLLGVYYRNPPGCTQTMAKLLELQECDYYKSRLLTIPIHIFTPSYL